MVRKRWPRYLAAALVLVGVGALIAAFLNLRRLEGAIPGKAAILSLGAIDEGYLVGTSQGLFTSRDGKSWSRVKRFSGSRVLVASNGDKATIHHKKLLYSTSDLKTYDRTFGALQPAVALAVDVEDNVYIAENARRFVLITNEGALLAVTAINGPKEVIALEGIPGDPVVLLTGGLTSGFWRSLGGDSPWRHILKTPVRTILVDPEVSERVFIGTAGGVLYSKDEGFKWTFTDMRLPTEALAEHGGRFLAITEDRLLYESKDGLKDWKRVAP